VPWIFRISRSVVFSMDILTCDGHVHTHEHVLLGYPHSSIHLSCDSWHPLNCYSYVQQTYWGGDLSSCFKSSGRDLSKVAGCDHFNFNWRWTKDDWQGTGCCNSFRTSCTEPGFFRLWCGLHQLDIILQAFFKDIMDEQFYSMLTGLISYLRRQQNLINDINTKAKKVADTRWESMSKVSLLYPTLINFSEGFLLKI
jgi:hypothetical protein